jgi:caspase domain-containing protein
VAPRLADPARSRAVLVGTAHYDDPDLEDIPAVEANVEDLAAVLADPGLGGFLPENVRTMVDPRYQNFGRELARWCREAEDVLVVYFSGHGLIGDDGGLLLAVSDTAEDFKEHSALPVEQLRSAMRRSEARIKVLVLDCCYSGRALPRAMADQESEVLGQVEVTGTYTLTSAPRNLVSLFVPGERNTVFSGELVRLLREGVADDQPLLALPVVHQELVRRLRRNGHPNPKALHSDTAADLALVRNRAYRPNTIPPEPVPTTPTAPTASVTTALRPLADADALVRGATLPNLGLGAPLLHAATARMELLEPLRAAALDPSWPILARVRFACHLAQYFDDTSATSALFALGARPDSLHPVRRLLRSLADDRTWAVDTVDDWDTRGLTRQSRHLDGFEPEALWGTVMAMLLSAAGLPVPVRLRALAELVALGHPDQAFRIAEGMLRERVLDSASRTTVEEFLNS